MILTVLLIGWSTWLPIIISALALIGTLGNFTMVLWRGRRHVRIRTSQIRKSLLIGEGDTGGFVHRCTVTNTGYIGVQIQRVELRSSAEAKVGILLELPQGEQPRKLDQG